MSANEITVYATSDLHAHWAPDRRGLARVLTLLERRDPARSVLIDNGDLLTGSTLGAFLASREAGPHPMLQELEAAGFDVAVPGNHDFDHGIDRLRAAVSGLTRLRYLCANCVGASGEAVFPGSTVVERDGVRIGVVGVVTAHVQRLSRYEAVRGVRFTDAVRAVEREVAVLRGDAADPRGGGVDLVVVAVHGGFDADPVTGAPFHYATGEDQAAEVMRLPGVDAVIAGHQHWARAGLARRGAREVAYVQPGYAGSHVGVIGFARVDEAAGSGAAGSGASAGEPGTGLPAVPPESSSGAYAAVHASVEATGEESPASGSGDGGLARLAAQAERWLDTVAPLDDRAIHRAVAARSRARFTALALPVGPRSWRALAAAFSGVYGVSRLRLPAAEYREMTERAERAGLVVTVNGATADGTTDGGAAPAGPSACDAVGIDHEGDVEVAVNSVLREFAPEGRIDEDLVVDWLDEYVYAAGLDGAPRPGEMGA